MTQNVIPEIDILIATSMWLWRNKAVPIQFSVANGHGIDSRGDQARLIQALDAAGVPSKGRRFNSSGPDIMATSLTHFWQVECKGAGTGKPATQRNNFDRAVASVVSYYTDPAPQGSESAQPTLGLALPATRQYRKLLRDGVPLALRKRLNLWVLLYQPDSSQIEPVKPDQGWA